MTELRTEEEQVEALKKWWKDNGTGVLLAVVIGLGGYFGFNYWKQQQQAQLDGASQLYNQLVQQVAMQQANPAASADNAKVRTLASELVEKYGNTSYGDFGKLFLARFAVDAGDFDNAAAQLKALADGSKNAPVKYTAQARLAQVLIQQDKLDEALALVNAIPDPAFAAQFEEAKGDALYRKGDLNAAREAYQRAQTAAQGLGLNADQLQRKMDVLVVSGDN